MMALFVFGLITGLAAGIFCAKWVFDMFSGEIDSIADMMARHCDKQAAVAEAVSLGRADEALKQLKDMASINAEILAVLS